MIPVGIVASGRRASDYAGAVLADAPALYWRLGESSGTTANDASGNGRVGTYGSGYALGATGLVPGDTAMTSTSAAVIKLSRAGETWMDAYPLTVEALWRLDTNLGSTAEHTIIARHGGNVSWDVILLNGVLQVRTRPSDVWRVQSCGAVTLGQSEHLAFVVGAGASGGTTVYRNGAQVASSSYGADPSGADAPLTVGSKYVLGGHGPFPGVIDEVALYAGALSASRILAHAQAGGFA